MLNVAVVGCGRMASELAERSVKMGRARIAAIHDIDPDVLQQRAKQFDAEPVAEIAGLLDRVDIDAFLVGSPGYDHHDNVLALAPAGKPIYSEKPLSTTVPRCDAMIATCKEHNVKLFVGQVLRLFPLFWKSHEILETGEIGTAQMVSVTRAGRGMHYKTGWRSSLKASGGPLLETSSHELDYLLFLLGEPATVLMQGKNLNGFGDYTESMFLQLTFKNGGLGLLHTSNASPCGEYRVHIQADNGNMLHGGFGGELRYQSFDATAPTIIKVEDLKHYPNPYDRELVSFFDWVEHDAPPLFTGETGRANVAVADAAYRSLETGKPESI